MANSSNPERDSRAIRENLLFQEKFNALVESYTATLATSNALEDPNRLVRANISLQAINSLRDQLLRPSEPKKDKKSK